MKQIIASVGTVAIAAACTSTEPNPRSSTALTSSADGAVLYAVAPEEGLVGRMDRDTRRVDALDLAGHPTRIARIDDRLAVTLRFQREVVLLSDRDGQLVEEERIAVGAEPYGVIASPDGRVLYVASSMSNRVDEIDLATHEVLRSWTIPDQPRGLAYHPVGDFLLVTSGRGAWVSRIRLSDGTVEINAAPRLSIAATNDIPQRDYTTRITGDPVFSQDGSRAVIPVALVDTAPLPASEINTDPPPPWATVLTPGVLPNFISGLVIFTLDDAGEDLIPPYLRIIQSNGQFAVGYPSAVLPSPDNQLTMVAFETTNTVLTLSSGNCGNLFLLANLSGVSTNICNALGAKRTVRGARGFAMLPESQVGVLGVVDRGIALHSVTSLRDTFDFDITAEDFGGHESFTLPSRLDPQVEFGRSLFFAGTDPRISAVGSGVACASCHPDARDDGLTWDSTDGTRQTPSLAGRISDTAPFHWNGDRATLEENALVTSGEAMGGNGMTPEMAAAIAAYIDSTPDVDAPGRTADPDRLAAGRAVFMRADTACASCHSGTRFTNNLSQPMLGATVVQTPSLTGISASAPYFHDGSAGTLREVVDRATTIGMGDTSGLTESEKDDLVLYLESL